ncbi:glycosyltransferase [Bacillus sp. S/N-304-OC-R1]|uniref:glycosyltransferase n=1 Tax=Bacillus sp. S/N-304-OC-R1 TaxID=2758034 RepID=UPI001C8EE35A|nr:glycosyltransferase [Bacillus sp. S/N-304-OC-R1]MBY0124240.1 glycosyltransferase [Bacillus sp. S/N-304-OC-R1]
MTKIKILFIMQSLQGGGAERVTLDLIRNLNHKYFESTILVVNYFGDLIYSIPENVNIIKVLTEREKTIFHPIKVITEVKRAAENVDLVIGSLEMTPTYLSSIASALTKKPAIGWVHTDVQKHPKTNNKIHKFLISKFYTKLKVIVAVSNGAKDSFQKMFPKLKVPVKRIYNPIRIEEIERMQNEKNDVDEIKEPIILGSGRLIDVKGFDVLIKAHEYLLENNVKNKLLILGEGEQREFLEKLTHELNVNNSVIFKGFVDNPYKYMRSASVFVLSSRYEGFSVVIAEALSLGIPVVSTDCRSGPAEILGDGKFGLLSPVNDYKALAMNIMKTLKTEQNDTSKEMRKKRAYDFSYEKIIPEFEDLFFSTIEKK